MARHPATVRIALTGHADIGMALRSITVCHQCLAKPCDGKMLKSALDGVLGLNSLLNEPSLIKAVGCVATLPADPGVFEAFETALTEAPVDPKSLADIVSQDPGLTAKVLQLAGTSFFGMGCAGTSVDSMKRSNSGVPRANPPDRLDEFAESGIESPSNLVEMFSRLYFGCEADDPMNALAFDFSERTFSAPLNAMLSSDIGHWDAPVLTDAIGEAFSMVEKGAIRREDFRSSPTKRLTDSGPT